MKAYSLIAGVLLLAACARPAPNGHSWGDTGDGRYLNPILAADYSDPDAIRVGDKYYMVASDFHFLGMQMLESPDLVNWRFVSQIYERFDLPGWDDNAHYSGGSWAPSIRWHDNKFWVYFCTPDEGLFMSTAERPEGPWTPLHCVKAVARWEDPCPFWDEDGTAYLGHSLWGAGPIILHKMSPDGRQLLDDGVTVYEGPVAEGTKIHKWNGLYYLSIPEGGVQTGWQTVLRARDIYGPYERKIVLETGSTQINGPHQGALVDTPEGQWWFLHFQYQDPLGRVVHLQPVRWEDGWPVIGEDYDGNGIGEPVPGWEKPDVRHPVRKPFLPASSDDFSASEPGLQWQFNHNPVDEAWSLTSHPGSLAITALPAASFKMARNTLSQKLMGFRGSYTVRLVLSQLADGQRAGLACMGRDNQLLQIGQESGIRTLSRVFDGKSLSDADGTGAPEARQIDGDEIWLRLHFDVRDNVFQFAWSTDGKQFTDIGAPFEAHFGFWKGARVALYSFSQTDPADDAGDPSSVLDARGTALFDDFTYLRQE